MTEMWVAGLCPHPGPHCGRPNAPDTRPAPLDSHQVHAHLCHIGARRSASVRLAGPSSHIESLRPSCQRAPVQIGAHQFPAAEVPARNNRVLIIFEWPEIGKG